jgi:nitrogen fixation/metabolism regulation signal transduction histidine kinase
MNNVKDPTNEEVDHVLTLGISYKKQDYLKGVDDIVIFTVYFIVLIVVALFLFVFILAISIILSFRSSHKLFRPLRKLNRSMREILADNMKRDLTKKANRVSFEINELYDVFSSLIRTKKFENNDLINQDKKDYSDALAVIDLAEACNMFLDNKDSDPNYRSAGICYNNIGNI